MRHVLLIASFTTALGFASRLTAAEPGWSELLKNGPDTPWQKIDTKWVFASEVALNPADQKKLKPTPADGGAVWINGTTKAQDLVTKEKYGDLEAHVEFLIAKGSNSGIKFHNLYELQIWDSVGKPVDQMTGNDCGGIYPTADRSFRHTDKGFPPKVNAAKPAGEWQTLEATFQAPRFDAAGKKISNAKIVKATLNGQVVQENQEMKTPTGANSVLPESATGPFMLQGDHGQVAFRNVKIRPLDEKK